MYALNQCLSTPISQTASISSLLALVIFLSYAKIIVLASVYYFPTTGIEAFFKGTRTAVPLALQAREVYSSYVIYCQKAMNRSTSESKFCLETKEKASLVRQSNLQSELLSLLSRSYPRMDSSVKFKLRQTNRSVHWAAAPCYFTGSLPVSPQQQHPCCHPSARGTCKWG